MEIDKAQLCDDLAVIATKAIIAFTIPSNKRIIGYNEDCDEFLAKYRDKVDPELENLIALVIRVAHLGGERAGLMVKAYGYINPYYKPTEEDAVKIVAVITALQIQYNLWPQGEVLDVITRLEKKYLVHVKD